ncbi:hypothetical protein A3L09_06060 [Thermococcus profundus]|uniref:Uncharacterized protein n=1 Tax=Thermococcus profundus TaxID=49899 RepID=A0A2Z2MDT7_THEPR|nr:UPF0175 family protein [Thermococcus profundus]ASJ02852.1 hypothetical protein A3L09_06060 [Thermococcus profundus]
MEKAVPVDFMDLLGPRPSEELRLLAAIELYRENKLSLGKAAEFAGISVREFLYELRKRNIPLNYDVEEVQRDIEVIEGLL